MFKAKTRHSALICLVTLIFIIVSLSGCINNTPDSGNDSGSSNKQVPVYQGMSIGPMGATAGDAALPDVWAGTNNGNGDNYINNTCVVADTPIKTLNNCFNLLFKTELKLNKNSHLFVLSNGQLKNQWKKQTIGQQDRN